MTERATAEGTTVQAGIVAIAAIAGWEDPPGTDCAGWVGFAGFVGFANFEQGLLEGGVSAFRSQIERTRGGARGASGHGQAGTRGSPCCNLRLRDVWVVVAISSR